jgi:hypothetical protein
MQLLHHKLILPYLLMQNDFFKKHLKNIFFILFFKIILKI